MVWALDFDLKLNESFPFRLRSLNLNDVDSLSLSKAGGATCRPGERQGETPPAGVLDGDTPAPPSRAEGEVPPDPHATSLPPSRDDTAAPSG